MMSKKTKVQLSGMTSLSTNEKKQIREGLDDVKNGRVSKVYSSIDEMIKEIDL